MDTYGLWLIVGIGSLVVVVVFIFVFVPALIAALNALKIESISQPATQMLGIFMDAIPNIFAAAVILAVAFFLSELIADLGTNLLGGIGFDGLPKKLGAQMIFPEGTTPSRVVGRLIVFFVMLFATVEAAKVVGFAQVSDIVAENLPDWVRKDVGLYSSCVSGAEPCGR